MRRNPGVRDDFTADVALSNIAGESLLTLALERIEDEQDRVLVLAHIALDTPLTKLARELNLDRRELAARVQRAIDVLSMDKSLKAQLGDVWRAGQYGHYVGLAVRLNLQHWFCSQCAGLMVQRGIGRPRKTCSDRCRRLLYEAGGASWKDQHEPGGQQWQSRLAPGRQNVALDTVSRREKLRAIMRSLDLSLGQIPWSEPAMSRDRAMLLLGFCCPIRIAPSDLASLDVTDVHRTTTGLEIRLFKRAARATQHVTVPISEDSSLCPVKAMAPWRNLRLRSNPTIRPLFVCLNADGNIPLNPRRLGGKAIANVVNDALWFARETRHSTEISASMPFTDFLEQLRYEPRSKEMWRH